MQDRWDAGLEGTGMEECRIRGMQERRDAGRYGCRKVWMQEGMGAGKYGCRKVWMQEGMGGGKYGCRKGGTQGMRNVKLVFKLHYLKRRLNSKQTVFLS